MRVSVVICTWDRCELLRRTLESLRSLVIPAGLEWELLVVNNNSPDATDEVIAAFQQWLPLRRVFERVVGLSRARNAGVRATTGELVLFTDDDVWVDRNWMTAYLAAAEQWPDARYFGGVIRPRFAPDVPRWVKRNQAALDGMLCSLDLGPVSRQFQPGEYPYGPNMAVRREAFALALFDERVGRRGDEQIRGSEYSLFRSLQQQQVVGVWVPAAQVSHYVPRSRASLKYFWSYYHGNGRSRVRLNSPGEPPSFRRFGMTGLRALARLCLQPWDWPRQLAEIARMTGEHVESRRLAVGCDVVESDRVET
jgi:glycosyltransferase involved in cell wall biosynthesis